MRNKAQIIWCYRRKTITLPPIEFKTIYHSLFSKKSSINLSFYYLIIEKLYDLTFIIIEKLYDLTFVIIEKVCIFLVFIIEKVYLCNRNI